MQENPSSGVSISPSNRTSLEIRKQTKDLPSSSTAGLDNFKSNELEEFVASFEFATLKKEKEFSLLHPSNRLELLHRYVQALGELSQEKYNKGLYLESLAVELVVLAIWKKALDICSTWLDPISEGAVEMPDAMEIIFQEALLIGTNGA
ncbi:serine/threonine kinase family protein, partial [Trifolium medium]|nr:serine/threonine kinase family protein [Trifolium medium]